MRYAAFETSSRRPSVAVRDGERLAARSLDGERPHASDLLPACDSALRELGLGPAEIDVVVVGTGPGSYTGLRVGIATALGLARGCGAELVGLCSLEAVVWGGLAVGREAGVLLDARASELYFARYRRGAERLEVVTAPCVLARPALSDALPPDLALFSDAAGLRAAGLADDGTREILPATPRATDLLELGAEYFAREGAMAPEQIEPLYLRAFAGQPRKR